MNKRLYWFCFLVLTLIFSVTAVTSSQNTPTDLPLEQRVPICPTPPDQQTNTAYDPCRFPEFYAFAQPDWLLPASPGQLDHPDLNVAYIMQMPRYEYSAAKNKHAPGDLVTFVGRIANRGSQPTGSFTYQWFMDDVLILSGTNPGLPPAETTTLFLEWVWQSGPHTVRLELDPDDVIEEVSEQNNVVEDRTDALAVGFWVEQSVYDWFNENQVNLGSGSVSWDDWAQRQLRYWNQMFATAVHPLTPQGVIERVRLDKVVIIPDGTWRDCANGPDPEDRTVDLVWGFPSELVGVDNGRYCPPFNFYNIYPQFQEFEPPLLHEMSHARYLVDLYGLNVYVNETRLTSGISDSSPTLFVNRNVENDRNFPLPAYLAIEGELVICLAKSGDTFTDCSRGAEGTTPRSHVADTPVHLATVRLQDGQGSLVQGSPAMPVIGNWDDHLYFNRYPDDLMSGGLGYGQHSAYAWNRIVGRRPVCGNYNAPCNIGEYLNDIPENNILEIRNLMGDPVTWAKVEVYQATPFPIWYGRYFDKTPDIVRFADAQGRVNLGRFPFGSSDTIVHTFGYSNAVLLLKITSGAEAVYQFFEVTEANEAYWSGQQNSAVYAITADLPPGSEPSHQFCRS
ncbi:MAG: hypothetical protein HF973_09045 [Chloroflexi bacterium]|nr:hypothetical protein [Chloroflexota bacterium]